MSNPRPFNTGPPRAYFITWTMYGTWLPGDDRGWRNRTENGILAPNELYKQMATGDMVEELFVPSESDKKTIHSTIEKHCSIRKWGLHQLSVRSNHVHVVVTAPEYKPETVRDQLKAWCTRMLKKRHPKRKRFWTEGASCRWINHEDDLDTAILYASEEVQDRKSTE